MNFFGSSETLHVAGRDLKKSGGSIGKIETYNGKKRKNNGGAI